MNGLISQLTTSVMIRPLGLAKAPRRPANSTPIIIGQTIAQIRIATAKLTFAYSSAASALKADGNSWPSARPAARASATQTERYFSKRLMRAAACGLWF